ncbi:hypothetical protein LLY41_10995 [Cytobacillus firmus]|uniref:hypothetical protein n=1 Tax=Cytobacillus firmus TaxID=1399 RepID=UPI002187DEE9|nr:hypothetical protein [Cytobacillus firmus]URM34857.1 hypothetical protein LLY41_10995 [Cytobacillus firmus]
MNTLKNSISYLLMIPAILIGTFAMAANGVSPGISLQNILIWIMGTVLCSYYLVPKKEKRVSKGNLIITCIPVALLVLPFLFDGSGGVHRWITFGPVNINAASIILPFLIIQLWKNRTSHAIALYFITLLILLFHPDAGQLTSFACAAFIILWKKISNWKLKLLSFMLSVVTVIISWIFLDDLAPVPFVEDIIFLVADLGFVWLILGVLSLLLLLSPFFYYGRNNILSLSLGVYFLMAMIVTLFGHFPMPIMGYGISPIIGYFLAVSWIRINN